MKREGFEADSSFLHTAERFVFRMVSIVYVGLLAGCIGNHEVRVDSVFLEESRLELVVGQAEMLHARVLPQTATYAGIQWESSNLAVARVNSSGLVSAFAEGEAVVSAISMRDSSKRAVCVVRVKARQVSAKEEELGELRRLHVDIRPNAQPLTPISAGAYSERFGTFKVSVSGFAEPSEADGVELKVSSVPGLKVVETISGLSGSVKTFTVSVEYDGMTAFFGGSASLGLNLTTPGGYEYADKNATARIAISDGQSRANPIGVDEDNLPRFNHYARTIDGLNKHYALTQSVTLTGQNNWAAIGTPSTSFTGSFNGNNNTLAGLTIHAPDADYQGMFGVLGTGAVIENLKLSDGSVTAHSFVGGMAGQNNAGTVRNCSTTNVKVVGSPYVGGSDVGGVVGKNNAGLVQNCHATGAVSGSTSVGGLVGRNDGDSGIRGTVQDCSATGQVDSDCCEGSVGGVVGYNGSLGVVRNCYATGAVASDRSAGGVAGVNEGMVESCYATGDVTLKPSASHWTTRYAGGVVAENFSGGVVRNCYASGNVEGSGTIGGVVGRNAAGTLENCYATGSVSNTNTRVDTGLLFTPFVGGILGWNSGTTQNCVALSRTVSLAADMELSVRRVASFDEGTLLNNYARNGMTLTYNNGASSRIGFPGGASSLDGQGTSQYDTKNFWRSLSFSEELWELKDDSLPTLKNIGGREQNPTLQP